MTYSNPLFILFPIHSCWVSCSYFLCRRFFSAYEANASVLRSVIPVSIFCCYCYVIILQMLPQLGFPSQGSSPNPVSFCVREGTTLRVFPTLVHEVLTLDTKVSLTPSVLESCINLKRGWFTSGISIWNMSFSIDFCTVFGISCEEYF